MEVPGERAFIINLLIPAGGNVPAKLMFWLERVIENEKLVHLAIYDSRRAHLSVVAAAYSLVYLTYISS